MSNQLHKLMNEDEAAKQLGLKPQTLRNWRHRGEGPAYVKMSAAVRYKPEELAKFINSCLIFPNHQKAK